MQPVVLPLDVARGILVASENIHSPSGRSETDRRHGSFETVRPLEKKGHADELDLYVFLERSANLGSIRPWSAGQANPGRPGPELVHFKNCCLWLAPISPNSMNLHPFHPHFTACSSLCAIILEMQ